MIETIETPDFAFREVLLRGINTYNAMHGFPDNSRTVAFFPSGSGSSGESGGALGYFLYGTLYIDLIYVPDSSRKRGTGRSLLLEAEEWARAHSCRFVWLHTFDFQAPRFYQRCGYERFAALGSDENGCQIEFYVKRL